ncbi:MAG: sodium/proline symporter PutP [Desulfobacteraceae bacterium]|nr:sodium/proline symporter PutP [Desulfobacteraceae bacterium]
MNVPTISSFIFYLMGMLGIGIYFYLRTKNLSDYVLGGRQLSGPVAALSAGASDMSGWLLLGLPGAMYAGGMNNVWIGVGLVIGAYLNWQFVAKRLRIYTEIADDAITLPDYLENRFNDESRILRVVSAIVILVFFTIYTSAGMVGGAILFKNTFGMNYNVALWVGAVVIVSYTFLGGYMAVCWTDFFQGLMMFAALLAVPIIAMNHVGGWSTAVDKIAQIDIKHIDIYSDMTFLSIISLMAWGFGYFGQPHILARFMSIRSSSEVPQAQLVGMSWMVFSLFGAIFVGFFGIAFFADKPLANSETVFIQLAQILFNPWIAGILLAAILAAIMSTIDSQLLVCSSTIAEDFYKQMMRRDASEKELVWIGRVSVIVIALIAISLASNPDSKVLSLVSYAWGGFGAAFGPVVILSLFWKRMTRNGALAGMVTGALTVIVWKNLAGGIFEIYEILPGFIFCAIAIVIASLIDQEPSRETQELFDKV